MRDRSRKRHPAGRFFGLCTASGYLFLSCFVGFLHTCGRGTVSAEGACSRCAPHVVRPVRPTAPAPSSAGRRPAEMSGGRAVLDGFCPACMFLQANHAPQLDLDPPLFQPPRIVVVAIEADELRFDDVGPSSLRIRAPPSFSS